MSWFSQLSSPIWSRRRLLYAGTLGLGITATTFGLRHLQQNRSSISEENPKSPESTGSVPTLQLLRDFDYGTVKQENGRTIREFRLTAQTSTLQLSSAVSFVSWNFNGRVPGPTLRAKQGDRVRVIFLNRGGHSHSIHFHGIHPAAVDGVRPVRHTTAAVYEFDAEPFGVHLYHCHVSPVTRHISKGLYGLFIIDPPQERPPADEMIMVMAGYDTNNDLKNEFYAFNGLPNTYMQHPIAIRQNQLIRLYLLNMVEYEAAVSFHLHANLFQVYRTGRSFTPSEETDVITMGPAERHILEFSYAFPGKYMFHPHQDLIAERGCMGFFEVS